MKVLHMDNSCLPRISLTWASEGNAREEDLKNGGEGANSNGIYSWVEAELSAANSVSRRSTISEKERMMMTTTDMLI